jgi:DNA-binding NarL/FixJ family response regulator
MVCASGVRQGIGVATRILIVDDDQGFRRTVRELLVLLGFDVLHAAADGEQALAAVSRHCPDGVLLDINLPGRDGYAVAAALASLCPTARIVLTSSDVDVVPSTVLADCGAAGFVPKIELATTNLRQLFGAAG